MERSRCPSGTHESPSISVIKGYPTEEEFRQDRLKELKKKIHTTHKKLVRKHSHEKGVSWNMEQQKWQVRPRWQNKRYCLGWFLNEHDAKKAIKKFRLTHPHPNLSLVQAGQRLRKKKNSRFKGVYLGLWGQAEKYKAKIQKNYKNIHLGYFPHTPKGEIAAARAYDKAALELFGEHAYTNEMEYGEYWK